MPLLRNHKIVPALMFHSIGLENSRWVWSHLSESVDSFEKKIALLRSKKFHSVFWGELYAYMADSRELPPDSILLTFDDGYLDNWVVAYPVLKKYGMRGTIFVNPDFVDPGTKLRPTLEDVWSGRCPREQLTIAGFLNWAELREMQRSGVMDIQSHTMTHTWYFSGPRIIDFHAPHGVSPYPWLFWNARPERKPFYLTEDQQEFVPWGYPIFEHDKALVVRRFFPDDEPIQRITDYVSSRGGRQFFAKTAWQTHLMEYVESIIAARSFPGRYETETEYTSRVRNELAGAKHLLETQLDKPVEFVCWPGGGNNAMVQKLARDIGFKAWTLSSREQSKKRNLPGADPKNIKRMSTDNRIRIKGYGRAIGGARFQLLNIFAHQNSWIYSMMLKGYKLAALAGRGGKE